MPKVIFRKKRCKGCGHCIQVCPKKIISFSEKLNVKGYNAATIVDEKKDDCIACASCARICPDCVITVEK